MKNFFLEFFLNRFISGLPFAKIRLKLYSAYSFINLSSNVNILTGCFIYRNGKISIGKNTVINKFCILDGRGGLKIGSNVSISPECAIYTAGHDFQSKNFDNVLKEVIIEDYCMIGPKVVINPGVKLGYGTIVLGGSVVLKSTGRGEIVGGSPAQLIGHRNIDDKLKYNTAWFPIGM